MGKHILIISQYFYPEQFRINDLASEWVKRGYKVTVITGIPNYPKGKFFEGYGFFKKRHETYNGVDIIRIPLTPRGHSSIGMVFNYLSFVVSGFFWKCFTRIKADYVFIFEVSPMIQALVGVWYAKRRKIPCYLYVTDLWPDNVIYITGIHNKLIINTLQKIVDGIYNRCDKILTSSQSFISAIHQRNIPSERILFWPYYAEDLYKKVIYDPLKSSEIPNDDILNIIFAGNIGAAQGLDVVPKAAKIVKDNNYKVRFNFVGDGRYKDTLIRLITEYNVEEMFNFIEKQPPERIPDLMAASDAALICLAENPVFEKTIPSKTQSCLACGIPIVVSANGEIQNIVYESGAGVASNAGDAKGLANNIINLHKADDRMMEMCRNALRYSTFKFNRKSLLDEIDKLFYEDSDVLRTK